MVVRAGEAVAVTSFAGALVGDAWPFTTFEPLGWGVPVPLRVGVEDWSLERAGWIALTPVPLLLTMSVA